MEPRTRAHLHTADENRLFARRLVGDMRSSSADLRWVVVAAFYSAVHLVNAYLWEQQRIEPRNHDERRSFATMIGDLRPVASQYAHLQDLAFRARYQPGFRISVDTTRGVMAYLEQIEKIVTDALPSVGGQTDARG